VTASQGSSCQQPHYATVVEVHKDVEFYQLGDADCADCLRSMAKKHEVLVQVFQSRLAKLIARRCRIYDEFCINPSYCDAHDACCAGDPNCTPSGHSEGL
jgi:hypothetical protein